MRVPNIILFLVFLSLPLFGHNTPRKETHITGIINNKASEYIHIQFFDNFINFEEKQFSLKLEPDGYFKLTLYISEPKALTFTHGYREDAMFLEPGDDLVMNLDAKFNQSLITYEGKGALHNNYLAKSAKMFFKFTPAFIRSQMTKLEPKEFQKFLGVLRNDKLNFFNQHATKSFSSYFLAYAQSEIDYWYAYQLFQYRWEKGFASGLTEPLPVSSSYFKFLENIELNNALALTNLNYTYFLNEYLDYQLEMERSETPGKTIIYPYKNAEKYFDGQVLSFIKTVEFYKKIKSRRAFTSKYEIEKFLKESPFKKYTEILSVVYEESKVLQAGQFAPSFELKDIKGNVVQLSDFKGKVVYLDFWATWCPPCIHELFYGARLRDNYFAGNKDVVFIYVSLDVNETVWKNYLKSNPAIKKGVHLFADGVYESKIAKDYNLKALPNFFLIDHNGIIVKNPARKPSEGGAKEDINMVLEKM